MLTLPPRSQAEIFGESPCPVSPLACLRSLCMATYNFARKHQTDIMAHNICFFFLFDADYSSKSTIKRTGQMITTFTKLPKHNSI